MSSRGGDLGKVSFYGTRFDVCLENFRHAVENLRYSGNFKIQTVRASCTMLRQFNFEKQHNKF